jgi:predicted MFS family arabinose efflux permease
MVKVEDMLLKILLFLIAFLVGADELMLGPILAPIGRELGVQPERVTRPTAWRWR